MDFTWVGLRFAIRARFKASHGSRLDQAAHPQSRDYPYLFTYQGVQHLKLIHAFVPGTPVPQGSVNVYAGRVVSVKPKLRRWRDSIRAALLAKHHGEPLDGPLSVSLIFQIQPPKKPRWSLPAVKPDADKLTRAVFDALSTTKTQRGVITDDARIVTYTATKTYHGNPGVLITITEAEAE